LALHRTNDFSQRRKERQQIYALQDSRKDAKNAKLEE
jgi:hypothetical protein